MCLDVFDSLAMLGNQAELDVRSLRRRFWWPGHRHRWVAGDAGRTAVSASG